ncbi:hypothetical protein C8R44DRAFT_958917, partial [Mycena epipterygia]
RPLPHAYTLLPPHGARLPRAPLQHPPTASTSPPPAPPSHHGSLGPTRTRASASLGRSPPSSGARTPTRATVELLGRRHLRARLLRVLRLRRRDSQALPPDGSLPFPFSIRLPWVQDKSTPNASKASTHLPSPARPSSSAPTRSRPPSPTAVPITTPATRRRWRSTGATSSCPPRHRGRRSTCTMWSAGRTSLIFTEGRTISSSAHTRPLHRLTLPRRARRASARGRTSRRRSSLLRPSRGLRHPARGARARRRGLRFLVHHHPMYRRLDGASFLSFIFPLVFLYDGRLLRYDGPHCARSHLTPFLAYSIPFGTIICISSLMPHVLYDSIAH